MSFNSIDIATRAKVYALQCVISATANWRELIAEKHADDLRNVRAAALLRAIAAEPADALPAAIVAKIAEFPSLSNAARDIAQRVGFTRFPDSLAAFLEDVLAHAGKERVR